MEKKKPGPKTIGDNFLLGSRNQWIRLLEENWSEVGQPLRRIRQKRNSTIADIRDAMILLKGKPNAGLADFFYRDTASVDNANRAEIRRNRLKLASLDAQILETQAERDMHQRQWSEVRDALREANPEEKSAVKSEATQRIKLLRQTKTNLRRMEGERASLERNLLSGEAHFCQSELLRFLHTRGRYAVRPRSLANALAGLPNMRWRQSHARCCRMPYDCEPHLYYQVVEIIERIWKRRTEDVDEPPIELFRNGILGLPKKVAHVRQFLGDNWRDLGNAIRQSWEPQRSLSDFPSLVMTTLVRNLTLPKSKVEYVLAAQAKLVWPTKKRGIK